MMWFNGKLNVVVAFLSGAASVAGRALVLRQSSPIESCPGYTASNVVTTGSSITADLTLAGAACNTFGTDLTDLKLEVDYESGIY